jgi:isochorismate synthase
MGPTTSTLEKNKNTDLCSKDLIKGSIAVALKHSFALACWSAPESNAWNILVDPTPVTLSANETPSIHTLDTGFLIAPFKAEEKKYFIRNCVQITIDNTLNATTQKGFETILDEIKNASSHTASLSNLNSFVEENQKIENYQSIVEIAKDLIQVEDFQKVVLARTKTYRGDIKELEKVLISLREQFPLACIILFYHPNTGLWISATPELLLSTSADGTFKTVALAGTQKFDASVPIREVSWTHKEIEEQALVSRYIINCFKTIRLRDYVEQGPRTVQAGNLLHLKTEYTAHTSEVNMVELGSTMLNLLHPTSAVCGMPKKQALDFISKHEAFNRKLFSGYCGPVNMNNETALYVTIRCAEVFSNAVTMYAGAGITGDSVPQKEYEETDLKMDVIGKAFSNL